MASDIIVLDASVAMSPTTNKPSSNDAPGALSLFPAPRGGMNWTAQSMPSNGRTGPDSGSASI